MILTKAEEISDIAFGFMGSKALFAALHFDIFTNIANGASNIDEIAKASGLHPERCRTLLTALTALGLISFDGERYANAPAAESFLVKGAKYDFGDYLKLQVDRQMYGLLDQIDAALADDLPPEATGSYADWFSDPEQARLYSESQHAGSLGPARTLARNVDLSSARKLLDVGGGTGAFAITLCEANPELTATIVDFPNVAALGEQYVKDAGLSDRIRYVPGNALETEWPSGQDVVLMSYLFTGVPDTSHQSLIARAFSHLAPGGRVLIHDLMVRSDRTGPKNAALWQLQHTAFTPKARSLDDDWLKERLEEVGFADVTSEPMIPDMTMLVQGVKPA